MAVDVKNDWKLTGGASSRMRTERKNDAQVRADIEKQPSTTTEQFFKGMAGNPVTTDVPKAVPKPVMPSGTAEGEGKTSGSDKPHEQAQSKAENRFQDARSSLKSLEKSVYKTIDTTRGDEQFAHRQDKAQPKQVDVRQQTQVNKDPSQVQRQTSQAVTQQSVLEKFAHPGKTLASEKAKIKDPSANAPDANTKTSEFVRAKTGSGQINDGSLKQTTAQAGMIASGVEGAKVEGKKSRQETKEERVKKGDDKKGRGVSSRHAYTGTGEAQSTTGELGRLLGGDAGSSSVDEESTDASSETVIANYEPVEWVTGVQTFTEIPELAKGEEVRAMALEHAQRTEKRVSEKVNYENWDLANVSIRERFVTETFAMLGHAQEILQETLQKARLPSNDPSGRVRNGVIC